MSSPTRSVRRSVSLPPDLVETALSSAPPGLRDNFNRLVRTALEDYVRARKAQALAEEMRAMAADPSIRQEIAAIGRDFALADSDGLGESE